MLSFMRAPRWWRAGGGVKPHVYTVYKKGEDTRRHTDECASRTGTLPHRSTRGTPAHRRQNDT